jgi:Flp pilus assembly protein TadD
MEMRSLAYINHRLPRFPELLLLAMLLGGCASQGVSTGGESTGGATSGGTLKPDVQLTFDQAVQALKAGQYPQAIGGFKQVARKEPGLAVPYVNMAIAYHRQGDQDAAGAALTDALKRNSRSYEAMNLKGILARENGDFAAARKHYEQALSIQPDYPEAHLNLAILCDLYLVDLGCASQHYARFQALRGDDNEVSGWMTDLKRRQKKTGGAQ